MNGHFSRWGVVVLAVLVALGLGVAYQAGVSHGLALQIPAGTAFPSAYYYGWYRPWGFGWFGPLFFLFIWFAVLRGIFWGGRRRWYYSRWHDVPPAFDDWHRRAHERMTSDRPSPTHL
jgi:hypothetical protein